MSKMRAEGASHILPLTLAEVARRRRAARALTLSISSRSALLSNPDRDENAEIEGEKQ